MKFYIGVSGFGKINHAEVDVSNFTVFVGNNNSGKTLLMQLIYGVLDRIKYFCFVDEEYGLELGHTTEFDREWFVKYEQAMNQYLEKTKDDIVYHIFNKKIPIKELYIRLERYDHKILVRLASSEKQLAVDSKEISVSNTFEANLKFSIANNGLVEESYYFPMDYFEYKEVVPEVIMQIITCRLFNVQAKKRESLIYLPSSRTGMLLLYRYFFAEKDTKADFLLRDNNEVYGDNQSSNDLGLTTPVYEFLQFLLAHTTEGKPKDEELLEFVEKNLLEGSLKQNLDETYYVPENCDTMVPLYLASSMVNELAPIVKVLTSVKNYQSIFYDEIEICMHPEKQQELARLLIRLNNTGRRLIVSTHSDTMATKINNLLLLAMSEDSEKELNKKLEKLNLTHADILVNKNVHVYQFINNSDGTSDVQELEFQRVPYLGYNFSQFSDSVQKLYDESLIVTE